MGATLDDVARIAEVGDGPAAWSWAAATGVLWGLSYFFWRRLQSSVPMAVPA